MVYTSVASITPLFPPKIIQRGRPELVESSGNKVPQLAATQRHAFDVAPLEVILASEPSELETSPHSSSGRISNRDLRSSRRVSCRAMGFKHRGVNKQRATCPHRRCKIQTGQFSYKSRRFLLNNRHGIKNSTDFVAVRTRSYIPPSRFATLSYHIDPNSADSSRMV